MNCSIGWASVLQASAEQRVRNHAVRHRRALLPQPGGIISDGTHSWLNFSGNDYLGLRAHPEVAQALADGARQWGAGSGASALVTGYHPAHRQLEQELAEFLEREAVLLCPTGYQANLAALTSLAGRGDRIVQDRLCHASLIDAARLSGARLARYPHADLSAMRRQLSGGSGGGQLLVTDGVFSMDGDEAPLAAMARLGQRAGAQLVVDDAHGIGVLGAQGGGLLEQEGLTARQVPVLIGTLGKAFGCAGAFIAGSRELIEHLVNEARSYIFTTALPPAVAAAGSAALVRVRDDAWRRDRLQQRVGEFRQGARRRGIEVLDSRTPIQPLVVGDSRRAVALADALRAEGYMVAAIRPPTVPRRTSRLRITLSAEHGEQEIRGLLEALERCLTSL